MNASQHNAYPARRWTIPAGTDQNCIILHLCGSGWVCEHTGPHAEAVQRLFGTAMIPTPYCDMPADYVLSEITRLNPDCTVTIGNPL